ncbi:matrixin family metalloprotease [Halosegnis sp.]|uniref:matrixin family metalloprotease n=1 Tax=Halosegnis sp. TaxID=2864959 RepID=UPI0035D525A7
MRRVVVVAALLVLGGCAGAPTTPSGNKAPTTTPAPTETWDGDPENHFRERTLTVAIEAPTDGRDYRRLVRAALDYWSETAEKYAGFPIDYEVAPDASTPDIRVQFVADVGTCGSETDELTAGCAPYLQAAPVDRPIGVRIERGYDDDSTVRLLEHELGHTLGLDHDDAPAAVMSAQANLTTLPQPNATDRALPWTGPNLTYYVDYETVPAEERAETREQVEAAFGYVADGAEGTVPENVTFTRTDNRTSADVVVRFTDADPCTSGGSCGSLRGFDPDGDAALETYSRLEVTLVDVDTEARGWHIGYWTARGFGLRGEELPAPLQSDDPDVRRSEWWR